MVTLVGLEMKKLYPLYDGDTVVLLRKYRKTFKKETYIFNCTTRFSLCVIDLDGKFKKFKWEDYGFDWVAIEIHGKKHNEVCGGF